MKLRIRLPDLSNLLYLVQPTAELPSRLISKRFPGFEGVFLAAAVVGIRRFAI